MLAALSFQAVRAEDPAVEKSKSYSKTYSIGSGDKVNLQNQFGEMKISTWDRNEIKVDVEMSAKAGTAERAQHILDLVSIEDGKNGSEVFFKTHIKDNKDNNDHENRPKGETENFKINYTVTLPKNTTLNASNSFGALSITDYSGALKLKSSFGSLTAGRLSQPENVTVEFGKGTISGIAGGKLEVKFSRVQVTGLSGDVTAKLEYGQAKLNIDNNLKKLDVGNSFGHLYLDADKSLSADFNIKTSFGTFTNNTDFPVKSNETTDADGHHRYYRGDSHSYTGKSGGGSTPIKVNDSFGTTTLGHNISFDINTKEPREKRETRVKV